MVNPPTQHQIMQAVIRTLKRFIPQYEDHTYLAEELLNRGQIAISLDLASPTMRLEFKSNIPFYKRYFQYQHDWECVDAVLAGKSISLPYNPIPESKPEVKSITMQEKPIQVFCFSPEDTKHILNSAEESRTTAVDALREIRDSLQHARDSLSQSQMHFNKLSDNLRRAYNSPGLNKLALLHRRMSTSENPEIRAFNMELESAMIVFGMRSYRPSNGEIYDSSKHERHNANQLGAYVQKCHAIGWMLDDEVLLRAIVDTYD